MYPSLSHILSELFGRRVPGLFWVRTYGLIVALGFIAAAGVCASELRRCGISTGAAARATAWSPWRLSSEAAAVAGIWGFTGAKVLYVLEHFGDTARAFRSDGVTSLASGYTMYGGLILAAAMVMRFWVRNGIAFWDGVDSSAPSVLVAYAISRIGCHLSGDGDWGVAASASRPWFLPDLGGALSFWRFDYPNNVLRSGVPITSGRCFDGFCTKLAAQVWPTSLWEFVLCAALCAGLLAVRRRITTPGAMFFLFLLLLSTERLLIEPFRSTRVTYGGFDSVQIISALMFCGAGIGIWVVRRQATERGRGSSA